MSSGRLFDDSPAPSLRVVLERSPGLGPVERARPCGRCTHPRGWHEGGRGGCLCAPCDAFSRDPIETLSLDRFEPLRAARRSDPGSSHAAARSSRRGRRGQAARVLRAIEETPGLRARDLAREIGLEAYTVRKRTAELRRAGLARNQSKTLDPGEELRWFPARERGKTHA